MWLAVTTGRSSMDELFAELAKRLEAASPDEASAALAGMIEHLSVPAAGTLMERLPPTCVLDYPRHRIELLVSSSLVELRAMSVEKEPFTVEWIETSIRPGDVFYDVGANVGAYSLIAAKVTGNAARVYAFEPAPASFHDLTRNAALNGCADSIVAVPVALWSEDTPLTMPAGQPAGAARHLITVEEAPGGTAVLGMRLDTLVQSFALPIPTHAKIDTDGHELEVLRGAERTLSDPEWRSIIVELDRADTARNAEIKRLLTKAGFDQGHRHEREPTSNFPDPATRPDVYWTFTKIAARPRSRVGRPRSPSSVVRRAQRRAVALTVAVIFSLFILLVVIPEELGDRPYDVFGLKL